MKLSVHSERWRLQRPFRIAGREWLDSPALIVEVTEGEHTGRGEAQGVFYLPETLEDMLLQVEETADAIVSGASRTDLLDLLPSGGARNAIDCALWDLESKQSGKTIWQLLDVNPSPVTTVFTIGLEDTPAEMAYRAAAASEYPVLKVKLDADSPIERVTAVRRARPDAEIVVDVNQSWTIELLRDLVPVLSDLELGMIEQPLPRGADQGLEDLESSITITADESCLDTSELETAARRYGMINIKLDKTGGLTEALRLVEAARDYGLKLMVGNMVGTSLAMAPSFVVAQFCDFVDIDGPLLLKHDRPLAMEYRKARVQVFRSRLWG